MASRESAARLLGKAGGKATAAKRTAAERSASAKKASATRWAPDPGVFERVLDDGDRGYTIDGVRSLIRCGYATLDRVKGIANPSGDTVVNDYYKPTPKGIKWWVSTRLLGYLEYPQYCNTDPATLQDRLKWKGLNVPITFYLGVWNQGGRVFAALQDGLLSFVSHTDYDGMPRSTHEYITVMLTPKGYQFYASLPRLVEVWE